MAKNATKGAAKALTSNRLGDGLVVYFTSAGTWSEDLADAAVYDDGDALVSATAKAEEDVAKRLVVGVYAFDAVQSDSGVEAVHYREQIRAKGPTVRPDLGKQAA
ncbi:MAG: DUF2849 domain-containing protein [Magnetovibrionaceae bacterium]